MSCHIITIHTMPNTLSRLPFGSMRYLLYDGETHVMSLHVVGQVTETDALKKNVYDVAAKYHINHVMVDIEPDGAQ